MAQADTYTISNKKVLSFLAAVTVLAGSVLYDLLIDDTRIQVDELESSYFGLRFSLANIERDLEECKQRKEHQGGRIVVLEEWRESHTENMWRQLKSDENRFSKIEGDHAEIMRHIQNEERFRYRQ